MTHLFKLFDLRLSLKVAVHPVAVPENDDLLFEVENLSFTYPHSSVTTLSNINLKIPAGKMIAIVGLNGAGKTTLIKMLCRLYDPTEGIIKLNGTDIRNYKTSDYRKSVSMVFQDFGKYNVSTADNIRFGDIDGNRPEADHQSSFISSSVR